MKIIKSITRGDKKILTIECRPDEQPRCFIVGQHYQLGYPHEDVITANEILDADAVYWDTVEQRWIK